MRRNAVFRLPPVVREDLEFRLIVDGFSNCSAHTARVEEERRRRGPTHNPLGGPGSPNQGLALVEDLPSFRFSRNCSRFWTLDELATQGGC